MDIHSYINSVTSFEYLRKIFGQVLIFMRRLVAYICRSCPLVRHQLFLNFQKLFEKLKKFENSRILKNLKILKNSIILKNSKIYVHSLCLRTGAEHT